MLVAVPKPTAPTTVTVSGPVCTSTVAGSPSDSPDCPRLVSSTATSPAARGARPCLTVNGLSRSSCGQLKPSVGAPLPGSPSAWPSVPTMRA
jgi:hypothetical protein